MSVCTIFLKQIMVNSILIHDILFDMTEIMMVLYQTGAGALTLAQVE